MSETLSPTPKDWKICSFCEEVSSDTETIVCYGCREYKGIMTIEEWEKYYGEQYDDRA
jgi:hypoxanthine phosphoribosyltransferase